MTDHYTQPINPRDLTTRLNQTLDSTKPTHGNHPNHSTMSPRRPRASSFDSQLSRLPRFTKSATMSTTDSNDSGLSRLAVPSAVPSSTTQRESVEIAAGDFSKPRVHRRSRRGTQGSSRSDGVNGDKGEGGEKDFRYYGRHGNQWLFNDFSVTDAVSKGFKRVFRKDNDAGDWYENRGK